MPVSSSFTSINIVLPAIPRQFRNFCVLTGRHHDKSDMSVEHPLALGLGGNDAEWRFPAQLTANNESSKFEQRAMQDKIIMFGRRDAGASGHHDQHAPIPEFKKARLFDPKSGQTDIFATPGEYNVAVGKHRSNIIHERSRQVIDHSIFNTHVAVMQFTRPTEDLVRVIAKALLGVGWRLFLKHFEEAVVCDDLRLFLDRKIRLMNPSRGGVRVLLEEQAYREKYGTYLDQLTSMCIRKGRSTAMLCECSGQLEFTLTCLGYYVGTMQLPIRSPLMTGLAADGQRLLIIFERESHSFEIGPATAQAA